MKLDKLSLGILFTLFLLVCYFPIFHHLEELPLQNFDESRLANSAMEMLENGNYLIPTFNGEPDMWNTKPPLMIWLQTLCMKIFGIGELAVRLPAALATLATVFLLIFFSAKYLQNFFLGIIAALILITTKGYIVDHVSRTGDYDALLTFFNTAAMLLFYLFVKAKTKQNERKYLFLTALCIVLAVYTKSIAGLLFLPAFFLYLLWEKKAIKTLKSKELYIAIVGTISLILGYYFLREHYNPGYLQAVMDNELGGRYLEVLENHQGPFSFYFEKIVKTHFFPWILLLPFSIYLGFKDYQYASLIKLLLLVSVTFLLIISSGGTKLRWYDAPVFPVLSLLASFTLYEFFRMIKSKPPIKLALLVIIFAHPYYNVLKKTYLPKPRFVENEYGFFMRKIEKDTPYAIANIGYNAHILFYSKWYQKQGYPVTTQYPKHYKIGDNALFCEQRQKELIDSMFIYRVLQEDRGCKLIKIEAEK